ncbi:hypothetical protein [Paenibacillus sp. Mc5Re-14]|uniref:hypothetical protein n=1 Tax=Paenibacillus sp. Mc5Re-14 TaxID=1030529 RepID=UPI000B01BD90|nr:hypothetical protein [Paenibacillus sp. Mc5Re-14]
MSLAIYFRETKRTKKLYICHLIDNGAKNAKITILRDVFGDLPKDTKIKAPLDWRAMYVRIDRLFKNKMMEAPAEKKGIDYQKCYFVFGNEFWFY